LRERERIPSTRPALDIAVLGWRKTLIVQHAHDLPL
jgi:hypothetical protein